MTIDRKFIIAAQNPINGNKYSQENAFLMCAKDAAVPAALRAYRDECIRLGANLEHVTSIGLLIERVEQFQTNIERRIPDTIGGEIARCLNGENV